MQVIQRANFIYLFIYLHLVSSPCGPDATSFEMTGPLCPISIQGSPVILLKFQVALGCKLSMSSPSKKEPRYACLSAENVGQVFILCFTRPT
jgi:hypothetical protein